MSSHSQETIQASQWGKQDNNSGPPEMDKVFKKLFSIFSGKSSGAKKKSTGSSGKASSTKGLGWLVALVILVLVVIWAISGFFIVQPAERAVVLRFGKYLETLQPGPHWIPRFIDSRQVVNVDQVMTMNLSDTMLTQKENIVDVNFAIQYRISNIKNYLFNVINPQNSLKQIVDSAVRQVIGTSTLDNILTVGRAKIASRVQQQIEKLSEKYQLGLEVTDVAMQPAKAPEQVKEAFDDVIKAREDNQRIQNEADAYANSIIPVAEGKASRILQQAAAYQKQVIYQAKGQVANFDALLPIYQKYPKVTASRMYLDTMQQVLSHSQVTVVDTGNKGSSLFYIPVGSAGSHVITQVAPKAHPSSASDATAPVSTQSNTQIQAQSGPSADAMTRYLRWKEAQGNA